MKLLSRLRAEFFPRRDAFDEQFGTDTSGVISLRRMFVPSENKAAGVHFKSIDPERFNRAMQYVPKDAAFIDLGCGKGRALILARLAGFSDITGVEFSPRLCKIAVKNLASIGCSANVFAQDATTYVLPNRPCVVFMYNPFRPPVFNRVIDNLAKHGSLHIVYVNPEHRAIIEQTGKFEVIISDANLFIAHYRMERLSAQIA